MLCTTPSTTGIFTLWAVCEEIFITAFQPALIKNRFHFIASCSWICGGLENDQLTLAQRGCSGFRTLKHISQIWLMMWTKWSRNAEHNKICFGKIFWIRSRRELLISLEVAKKIIAKMQDVSLTIIQGIDLLLIDIESDHGESAVSNRLDERKSHVPQADDGDDRCLGFDFLHERLRNCAMNCRLCGFRI